MSQERSECAACAATGCADGKEDASKETCWYCGGNGYVAATPPPETISAVMRHLGKLGGAVKSERKAKASAANLQGKRTGRSRLPDDQLSPSARSKRKKREAERAANKGEL